MTYYWDSSALLNILFQEKYTHKLKQLMSKRKSVPAYTSFFTFIEIESAISRRLSEGSIRHSDLIDLRIQIQILENILGIIWSDITIMAHGREMILKFGLKPGDALQLSSALALKEVEKDVVFLCLDQKLNKAAHASDLQIFPV